MLTKGDKIEDFKEVTEAEREALEAADAQWVEPPQSFIEQWNAACMIYPREYVKERIGRYNPNTGFFELRQLLDLTYEDAVAVCEAGRYRASAQGVYFDNCVIRTNLPCLSMEGIAVQYPFYYNTCIEVANADNMTWQFPAYHCLKLHTINNIFDVSTNSARLASYSDTIVNVTITRLTKNLNVANQSKITRESFQNIVTNAKNTSEITISVHPDVYAKMIGDTTNAAAAALSEEELAEWMALVPMADSKNILFAAA